MVLPINSSLASYYSPQDTEEQTDEQLSTTSASLSSIISLTRISSPLREETSCSSSSHSEENENSPNQTPTSGQHRFSKNRASNSPLYDIPSFQKPSQGNLDNSGASLKQIGQDASQPEFLKAHPSSSIQVARISGASFFSTYSSLSHESYHSALSSFDETQQYQERPCEQPSYIVQSTKSSQMSANDEAHASIISLGSCEPSLASSQSSLTSYDGSVGEGLKVKYNYPRSLPIACLSESNSSLASHPTRRQLEELKQQYQEYSDEESDDEPTTPETPMLEVFKGALPDRPFSISSRHGVHLVKNPKMPVLSLPVLFTQSQQIRHSLHVKYPFLTCIKNGNKDFLINIKRDVGILALTLGLMNSGKSFKGLKELLQDPLSEEEQQELRTHCQDALVTLEQRLYREIHDEITDGLAVLQTSCFPIYKGPVSSRSSEKSRNILSQLRITYPTVTKSLINKMACMLESIVKNQETIAKLKQHMPNCSIGSICVAYTFYSHETKIELGYPYRHQRLRNLLTVGVQKEISKTQKLDCLFF